MLFSVSSLLENEVQLLVCIVEQYNKVQASYLVLLYAKLVLLTIVSTMKEGLNPHENEEHLRACEQHSLSTITAVNAVAAIMLQLLSLLLMFPSIGQFVVVSLLVAQYASS